MADGHGDKPDESSGKTDGEQETVTTLSEYFEQQRSEEIEQFEEEHQLEIQAEAVLGGSDDTECTYDAGYVKRQALYACVTCARETGRVAGVCLACSLACHDGHTQYELYTKRLFRCDCGNSRFKHKCKLVPVKAAENDANQYGENFDGLYCTCKRPYPDPEAEDDVSMYQCCVCENWFHLAHLSFNAAKPASDGNKQSADDEQQDELEALDAEAELTCHSCMQRFPFLEYYRFECSAVAKRQSERTAAVEQSPAALKDEGDTKPKAKKENADAPSTCRFAELKLKYEQFVFTATTTSANVDESGEAKAGRKESESETDSGEPSAKSVKLESAAKTSTSAGQFYAARLGTAQIWTTDWRDALCKCSACNATYERLGCTYLADPEDTLDFYETKKDRSVHARPDGAESAASAPTNEQPKKVKDMTTAEYAEYRYERFWDSIRSRMPRDAQNEMVLGIREMTEAFNAWLATLPAGHVVTEAEARDFFAELRRRREARRDALLNTSGVYN